MAGAGVKRRRDDDDCDEDDYSIDEIVKCARESPISINHDDCIYREYLFDRDCGDHVEIGYKIVSYEENCEIPDPSKGIMPREVDHSRFVVKYPKEMPENMTMEQLHFQLCAQAMSEAFRDGTLSLRTEEEQSSSSSSSSYSSKVGMESLSSSYSSSSQVGMEQSSSSHSSPSNQVRMEPTSSSSSSSSSSQVRMEQSSSSSNQHVVTNECQGMADNVVTK